MTGASLWLARHGSTSWSERGRLQGWAPIGLSERGADEATVLARQARELGVRTVLTSPLRRARDTAQIVARAVRAPAIVRPELRELNYGALTGCTTHELNALAPALAAAWQRDPWSVRFARNGGALDDIVAALGPLLSHSRASGTPVLWITHGHVIRAVMTVQQRLARSEF